MQMVNKKSRIVAFLLAVFLLLAIFFYESFVVTHIHHDCVGDNCPICLEIQMVEGMIQQIGLALIGFVCILAGIHYAIEYLSRTNLVPLFRTPVKLKVRMND